MPGRKPAGAALKEREGLSDGPPPQEARPSGILPPRSSPVHTIRNDSTPPWGTGRRARSARSTEQQDKQPERPLSELSKTRPAAQEGAARVGLCGLEGPPAPPRSRARGGRRLCGSCGACGWWLVVGGVVVVISPGCRSVWGFTVCLLVVRGELVGCSCSLVAGEGRVSIACDLWLISS